MAKQSVEAMAAETNPHFLSSPGSATDGTQSQLLSDLSTYLGNLGLGDADLAKVISLLQSTQGGAESPVVVDTDGPQVAAAQSAETSASTTIQAAGGSATRVLPEGKQAVKLFIAEEQQILMQAYRGFFSGDASVELVGSSENTSSEKLIEAALTLKPKVMLLGVKALRPSTVEIMEALRDACPELAIVLLFAFYDSNGVKALREYSRNVSVGRAYLLKHTIDTVDQLTHAISSVAEGRMIVDPTVMEELIKNGDPQGGLLRDLSPRALEVLHWVSRGYRNETIAGVLSRDVKTVERHINNIYTTLLDSDDDSKHPRVRAALMYLKATGVLSTEQLSED